jgi:glycerophosphoryl diester phosphodiesterase
MRETHCYHRRRGLVQELLGWRPRRTIPFETLEDLLAAVPGMGELQHLYLNLRLEESLAAEAYRLAARLAHFAATDGGALMFHVMSPHQAVVEALQQAARRGPGNLIAYAVLSRPGFVAAARERGVRSVTCRVQGRPWSAFRAELAEVLAARKRGTIDRVVVWTVNDPARLEELFHLGPDAILTDDIPLALRLMQPAVLEAERRAVSVLSLPVPVPEAALAG